MIGLNVSGPSSVDQFALGLHFHAVGRPLPGWAAFPFRFPHRAADKFEFEEPAFEGAVEERRATTGGQPDQLGQTKICRKEVRPPTCEVLL